MGLKIKLPGDLLNLHADVLPPTLKLAAPGLVVVVVVVVVVADSSSSS